MSEVTTDQAALAAARELAEATLEKLGDQLEAGADRQWLVERAMYRLEAIAELIAAGGRPTVQVLDELDRPLRAW